MAPIQTTSQIDWWNPIDLTRLMQMTNEYMMICPVCRMNSSMNYHLSKKEDVFICTKNPEHKFKLGKDGFLKSV